MCTAVLVNGKLIIIFLALVDSVNTLLALTIKLETSYTVNNKKMILKPRNHILAMFTFSSILLNVHVTSTVMQCILLYVYQDKNVHCTVHKL